MLEPIKLKFYNEFIYTQLDEHLPNERDEKITTQIIENIVLPLNIAKDADIKDVGSGYGYFQIEMLKHGYTNICCLDYNLNTVRSLQERNLNFDRRDMSFLPNKDEAVDFIFARQCIQHSVFPEVPCPQQPANHEMAKGVYSILTLEMWAALFYKSGFDVELNQVMTLEYNKKDSDEKIQDQHFAFLLRKKRPMDIK